MLGTLRPSTLVGVNFQSFAAARVRSAKYWLGPGASRVAWVTLPDSSTFTFTLSLTLPRMVFRAFCGASGKICCRTLPRTTPLADVVAGDSAWADDRAEAFAAGLFAKKFAASCGVGDCAALC